MTKKQPIQQPKRKPVTLETIEISNLRLIPVSEADDPNMPRRVSGVGITTAVNRNGREYPAEVLALAVTKVQQRIADEGWYLLGQLDHPEWSECASLEDSCVNWDKISFDGTRVLLEGVILKNGAGKDLLGILESGVMPRLSQRGYISFDMVQRGDTSIMRVSNLEIEGYDFVISPSDYSAGTTSFEHEESYMATESPVATLATQPAPPLTLAQLKQQNPDLVNQILAEAENTRLADAKAQEAAQAKAQAELDQALAQLREAAGVSEGEDLEQALEAQKAKLARIEEAELKAAITTAVNEYAEKLKYKNPEFKTRFAESVLALEPKSVDEAKKMLVTQQKTFDALAAAEALEAKGYKPTAPTITGNDVLESELGIPSYGMAGFRLMESMQSHGIGDISWLSKKVLTPNQRFAEAYMKRYLRDNENALKDETRRFLEATTSTGLLLPASVMFGVIPMAIPQLVATSIFEVSMTDKNPFDLWYRVFTGESGKSVTVTNEVVTASHDAYVNLDGARLDWKSAVVTSSDGQTTYDYLTDYLIDHVDGKFMAKSTGAITNGQSLKVSYTYQAIRKGEGATIERMASTNTKKTVSAEEDNLAAQITEQAIMFSQSQLNENLLISTMRDLVFEIQKRIDGGIFHKALNASYMSGNTTTKWTKGTDSVDLFFQKIGEVAALVQKDHYQPTFALISSTNAAHISNSNWFSAAGQRPDSMMDANGVIGKIKGLTLVQSTEFPDDTCVVGNSALVQHFVYRAMEMTGPFQVNDETTGKLKRIKEFVVSETNATEALINERGGFFEIG